MPQTKIDDKRGQPVALRSQAFGGVIGVELHERAFRRMEIGAELGTPGDRRLVRRVAEVAGVDLTAENIGVEVKRNQATEAMCRREFKTLGAIDGQIFLGGE